MQFFLQAMWNNTAISTFELHVTLFFYFEKHYLANNSLFSRKPKEINFTTQKEDSGCFLDKKQEDCFSAIYSIVNSCNLKQSERPTFGVLGESCSIHSLGEVRILLFFQTRKASFENISKGKM